MNEVLFELNDGGNRIPKNFNDTGNNAKLDSIFLILEMNMGSNV